VAPGTDTEQALARIWAEVLKVPRVGIHDNFFELGGHSLSAMQVLARVRSRMKLHVSIVDVMQTQTIRQLAEVADRLSPVEDGEPIKRQLRNAGRDHLLQDELFPRKQT
jgi:acyl carrier protein